MALRSWQGLKSQRRCCLKVCFLVLLKFFLLTFFKVFVFVLFKRCFFYSRPSFLEMSIYLGLKRPFGDHILIFFMGSGREILALLV